jgi:hypothetical protein
MRRQPSFMDLDSKRRALSSNPAPIGRYSLDLVFGT